MLGLTGLPQDNGGGTLTQGGKMGILSQVSDFTCPILPVAGVAKVQFHRREHLPLRYKGGGRGNLAL